MSVIFYYTHAQSFKNWTLTLEYNGQVSKAQTWVRVLLTTNWKKHFSFLDPLKLNNTTCCFLSNRAVYFSAQCDAKCHTSNITT